MFIEQAAAQFEIWTGETAPRTVMKKSVLQALGAGLMSPDFKAFESFAKQGNVVPVHKVLMADLKTPVSAYLKLAAGKKYSFLLESVEGGENVGRYTFLGTDPFLRVTATGKRIEIERSKKITRRRGNIFDILREIAGRFQPAGVEGLPPFSAGAVGFAGYELVRLLEPRVPPFRKDDVKLPDAVFLFFSTLLAFDHVKHQIHVISNVRCDEWKGRLRQGYNDAKRRIARVEKALAKPLRVPRNKPVPSPLEVRSNVGKEYYCQAVEKAKEYILAGDIFQVVLSQRLEMEPQVGSLPDLPRPAHGQPLALHVLHPSRRYGDPGQLPGDAGQGGRARRGLPPDRGYAAPRRDGNGRPGVRERLARGRKGAGRTRHARRPRAQRCGARLRVFERTRATVQGAGILLPRDAHRVEGFAASCAPSSTLSTPWRLAFQPEPSPGRRRFAPWRSLPSWNLTAEEFTRAA